MPRKIRHGWTARPKRKTKKPKTTLGSTKFSDLHWQDYENQLWHCVSRMFERYGIREEDAQHMVRWHFRAVNARIAEPFRLLYTFARGSVRVFQVEHCGRYFYPVVRRGRLSKEWVIATYLAEDMVWDNMMDEFTMSFLLPQKPRTDATLDFDDDPENNGCSSEENIVDYDSLI